VRFPYQNGDLKARGAAQKLADIPGGGRLRGGGHWTRDIVFSRTEPGCSSRSARTPTWMTATRIRRNTIAPTCLQFTPEGKFEKVYAYGIRNCVGEAINPITGALWCSTNERDALGDNLVPDYITHVEEGGFYGWPWYYMGGHQDPRHAGKHPELKSKVLTPDVLLQPHFASLEMLFYDGAQFPAEYKGTSLRPNTVLGIGRSALDTKSFACRSHNGNATGEYEDFLTGFVTRTDAFGGARWVWQSRRTVPCSSATMDRSRSGT
jgi:glucose/arabinose dehydrogenase